jgi:hypothetical protein
MRESGVIRIAMHRRGTACLPGRSPSTGATLSTPATCVQRESPDANRLPGPIRPEEDQPKMETPNSIVAVFNDHAAAEAAVKKLGDAGFDIKNLSVVGKGYHTEEKVVGFYNAGDRIKFWGMRGAFWGLFVTVPIVGQVVVLGYLAAIAISAVETAAVVGGLSALSAALYSIGIPKDSVVQYEAAVKADGFMVMAHGTAAEMTRAQSILGTANPSRLDLHAPVGTAEPKVYLAGGAD